MKVIIKTTALFILLIGIFGLMSFKSGSVYKLPKNSIRIGIYNVRMLTDKDGINNWEFRKDSLVKIILENKMEIVGMQEVHPPQLKDIVEGTSYAFVGEEGLYDPVIYNSNRFEVIEWNTGWLSESMIPHEVGWDAKYKRYYTWVKFKDKRSKKIFYFFNTHFDHKGLQAKTNSATLISNEAKKIAVDVPLIVSGDFNSRVNTEAYRILTENFDDARKVAPVDRVYGPIGTAHLYGKVHPAQIDYFFVNKKIIVHSFRTIDESYENGFFPSDHYPVYIDFTIKK